MGALLANRKGIWYNMHGKMGKEAMPLPQKRIARYRRNLKYAFFPSLLLCFMYIVWGPMEVYMGNAATFRFGYFDILLPMLALTAACTLAIMLVISFFPRKLFRLAVSSLFALSLCSYIQNLFLNLNLGLLEGEEIPWADYAEHGKKNLLLWIGMFIAFTGGLVLLRKRTRRWARRLSAALLAVLVLTMGIFTVQYLQSDVYKDDGKVYLLDGSEQYHVSAEGNVILFLLDYFSNDYIDATLEKFPDILEPFHDFTYYDNCDPTYIGTFPSLVHMLTGAPFDTTVPIETWFKNAWGSESARYFYRAMRDQGYAKFNFFDTNTDYFGLKYAQDYVSNLRVLEGDVYTMNTKTMVKTMLKLSLYRHLPHMFKQRFYMASKVFNTTVTVDRSAVAPCYNGTSFNWVLREGLTPVSGEGKYFIVQFLRGTHPPYEIDHYINQNPDATLEEAAAGYLKIVANYLDALKAAGVYDDATIILTSDHGDKENSMQVLYFIKEPNVHREEMATSSAPISHNDMLGTLMHAMGGEYPYGESIYDFSEGDARERTVMRNYIDTSYPYVRKYKSLVNGTHTVMYAYTYTGNRYDLRKQIRRGPTQILPLTESFN